MIKQVAIVGGTHGNEFTGIYLLKKWQQQPQLIARDTFAASTLFANTKAFDNNCRYIDNDLNRRFSRVELEDASLSGYEESRAKVINQQLGPKGNPQCDFVIDLHTTTSNMGPTLLLPTKGKIYTQLAAYAKQKMPELTIFSAYDDQSNDEHFLLCTIGKHGVIIEVGPVPQAVLRQDVFEQTEQLSQIVLDFIDLLNRDALPELPNTVTAFRFVGRMKLPLNDEGERIGMLHKNIQDNDFKPIQPGDPVFTTFDGEEILYQGDTVVYPAFANEAAYYDNNLAMSLLEQVELKV